MNKTFIRNLIHRVSAPLLFLPLVSGLASCQSSGEEAEGAKVVLNEVLTLNKSNFQDDYGVHQPWIEVFNKSYGTVDIAGYRLAVSAKGSGDTVRYNVPKGDVLTKIKPRQHALFWADGNPNRGTFHTSCCPDTAAINWVGLYDNGGKLIDQIEVPVLPADHSYAREDDAAKTWVVKGGNEADSYVTPSTNNMTIEKNVKQERFMTQDAYGFGMSITAMTVVFCGLILLYVLFRLLGMLMQSSKTKENTNSKTNEMTENQTAAPAGKEDEVYAAIAMALHEELGCVHDEESGVLTIVRKSSQWNAKHLMLRK